MELDLIEYELDRETKERFSNTLDNLLHKTNAQ